MNHLHIHIEKTNNKIDKIKIYKHYYKNVKYYLALGKK